MAKIAISANRTLYVFHTSEVIYLCVDRDKKNVACIGLTGNRTVTVRSSLSALYKSLSRLMEGSLMQITRDECINIDYVMTINTEGYTVLSDIGTPGRTLKFLVSSRQKVAEVMDRITGTAWGMETTLVANDTMQS